jgi:hypothetical protein
MREGDVPSIQIAQALQYVGHLKSPPPLEAEQLAYTAGD